MLPYLGELSHFAAHPCLEGGSQADINVFECHGHLHGAALTQANHIRSVIFDLHADSHVPASDLTRIQSCLVITADAVCIVDVLTQTPYG